MFKVSKSGHPAISAVRSVSNTEEPSNLKRNLGTTSKVNKGSSGNKGFESTSSNVSMRVTGSPNTTISGNAITIDVDPMLTGMTPQTETMLHTVYRDIYYNDSVAGSAVDLISMLPFGEFNLGGFPSLKGDTRKVSERYLETIERLNFRTLLPEISIDYLVLGEHCSSLLYNKEKKLFTDLLPHQADDLKIEPLPFYSQDPIITVTFPKQLREIMQRDSPRIKQIKEHLGADICNKIIDGTLELDPLSTIYVARRTFSRSDRGTSYFRRILPIYLIEKNLFRGTLVESARRQRGILHLSLGDGDQWIPSVQDMEFMTELFMNADSDPIGAIIATRSGVSVEELRQGGDFWKSTDFADSVLSHKLRALSISEGFLSGDANYDCVIGNTFVQTEHGILRIGEIADRKNGKLQDFDIRVNSRFGIERCAKWLYSGKAPVIEVASSVGATLTGTPKHKILKLDETLDQDWTRLDKICVGDWLAMQTNKFVRKTKLRLNLSKIVDSKVSVTRPKVMTPELAYLIGAVLSEGTVEKSRVIFPNTDTAFIDRVSECFKSVFGRNGTYLRQEAGVKSVVNGIATASTKDYYALHVCGKAIITWLEELGLNVGETAYTKTMPWSILQSDEECLYAFLAAYLEGDGCIHKRDGRISYFTKSDDIRSGLVAILQALGLNVTNGDFRVNLPTTDSRILYASLQKYLISKTYSYFDTGKAANSFGIPMQYVRDLMKLRKQCHNRHGAFFTDDSGNTVQIVGYKKFPDKMFLYDAFDSGKYDEWLQHLKLVSLSTYEKLLVLLKHRYRFVQVTSVKECGKQDVYDLSMRVGVEPAYVANGFISHNTSGNALTVFLDMIRTFRETMTRKLFYDTLFPLISLINGFTVKSGRVNIDPNLMNRISSEMALHQMNDGSKLFIPSVQWQKQLKPEGDTAYIELLQTLTDKGVPVPLRALAAAGGLDLDTLLRQQDEDIDVRERIKKYMDRIAKLNPQPAAEGEEAEASDRIGNRQIKALKVLASVDPTRKTKSSVLAHGGKRALLNRDFSNAEPYELSKTGKPKHVFNRPRFEARANERIIKAIKNIRKLKK